MRLGVLGCGRVFEHFHLPALRNTGSWDLKAVSESNLYRQEWVRQALPNLTLYSSLDQMLDQAQLDAVLVATPPLTHTTQAAAVIDRGLHVLVEKPGGYMPADTKKLKQLASGFSGIVWVGFNRRFNPVYLKIREIVQEMSQHEDAEVSIDLSFSVRDWSSISGYLGDDSQAGDVRLDVASHQLDLLAWVFSSPLNSVRVRSWDANGPDTERLAYDVRLENGVLVHCLAEHGESYREFLTFKQANRTLQTYPTGVLSQRRAGLISLKRWSGIRYWIDRKLIRIGFLVDPQQLSYLNQLEAFAAAIRGEWAAVEGSSVEAAVETHRALDALSASRSSSGDWYPVRPNEL